RLAVSKHLSNDKSSIFAGSDLGQALRFLGVYGPKDVNLRKSIKEDIMKVNSLLIKTALAAAVASVSFGATAATFNLDVPAPTTLANEIFGNGSETTIVQLPTIGFDAATNGGDLAGEVSVAGLSTIKLTLGGATIFGEVCDDPADWLSQNINITVGGTRLDETNATVSAGGTNNDNQITITLTAAGLALDDIKISGLKVQQLKSSLERQG